MVNLTLRQLRYVEALARHRHFGRAADACAISQPALSMQIKEVEEELGTELFERGMRQVRLTGFGQEVLLRIHDILRSTDELGDLARASHKKLSGRFRIGVIPTIAPYLLPTIIRDLTGMYPDLDVHVRETLTGKLIEELKEGRLDTAIVALPVSEPVLTEISLFTENFVLIRPSTDEGKPVPNREALCAMRLLLLEEGHCFREQALSFCDMRSMSPRELLDGSSLSTLVQMVSAGIGVTLVPEMALAVETRSAPVSIARFKSPQPSRTIGMIWRRTSPLAEQLRQISEVVRSAGQQASLQASPVPGDAASQPPKRASGAATRRAARNASMQSCGASRGG
jgi:LysR family hydrogen peroxide-inducible transcriptional activator